MGKLFVRFPNRGRIPIIGGVGPILTPMLLDEETIEKIKGCGVVVEHVRELEKEFIDVARHPHKLVASVATAIEHLEETADKILHPHTPQVEIPAVQEPEVIPEPVAAPEVAEEPAAEVIPEPVAAPEEPAAEAATEEPAAEEKTSSRRRR